MSIRALARPPSLAVLHIGAFAVEWYERGPAGEARHARIDVAEPSAALLARAAEDAWRAAGAATRRCVLSIGRPHAFHKLIALPRLARGDLAEVLRRKAQVQSGTGSAPVFFVAREMKQQAGAGQAVEHSWLLAGLRAGVRELRTLLRDQGFHVQRVVSSELAALEWGRQRIDDPSEAGLVLVVSEVALSVSLVEGERLIYQESIEGDLAVRPGLASGLVHEIKTCAAFWRKESRGKTLGQVVVAGLPSARVDLLAVTLGTILPGARVRALADEHDPSGRMGLLEAAWASGPLAPELTFWLPQRRRLVGLASTLVAAAAVAVALVWHDSGRDRLETLREEARALRRATADLEQLRAEQEEAQLTLAEIVRHTEREQGIARHGVPFERVLATVLAAFEGHAVLETLRMHQDDEARTHLTLEGRCPGDSRRLVADLRAVLARLERDPLFGELELTLPERFESVQGLASFSIETVLGA